MNRAFQDKTSERTADKLTELQDRVKARNEAESARTKAFIDSQNARLPVMADLDVDSDVYWRVLRNCIDYLTGKKSMFIGNPDSATLGIVQLLQYQAYVKCTWFAVKKDFSPERTDEENIEAKPSLVSAQYGNQYERAIQVLRDLLWVMGKVAKKINSMAYPSIIKCTVKMNRLESAHPYSQEIALAVAKDIIDSWWTLCSELNLYDEEEKSEIYPNAPIHHEGPWDVSEEYFDKDQFPDHYDPEDATKKSRDFEYKKYLREMADLLPKGKWDGCPEHHPIGLIAKKIKNLADEMDKGKPSIDDRKSALDLKMLAEILSRRIVLSYASYEQVPVGDGKNSSKKLVHCTCWEATPAVEFKRALVEDLERLITSGAKLARQIKSRSYESWTRMLVLLKSYGGDFCDPYAIFSHSMKTPAKDVKEFTNLLRQARHQIWSDMKLYDPNVAKVTVRLDRTSIEDGASAVGTAVAGTLEPIQANLEKMVAQRKARPQYGVDEVVALVREVSTAGIPKIRSLPSAVRYIRYCVADSDNRFYERAMLARKYVKDHAKKVINGEEMYWKTICQYSKTSDGKNRRKRKHVPADEDSSLDG